MRIYKYILSITEHQTVRMVSGAKILSVQVQNGQVCLWAEVSPHFAKVSRRITMHGTGDDLTCVGAAFIGTVQISDFVWHVYDLGEAA